MVSTMFPVSTDHQKNVFLLKKYKTMCITSSCKYLIPRLYLPHMFDHEICFAGITAETLMENQVVHGVTSMTQDHPRNGTIVMCVCVKKVRLFKKEIHEPDVFDVILLQMMTLRVSYCGDICWVFCLLMKWQFIPHMFSWNTTKGQYFWLIWLQTIIVAASTMPIKSDLCCRSYCQICNNNQQPTKHPFCSPKNIQLCHEQCQGIDVFVLVLYLSYLLWLQTKQHLLQRNVFSIPKHQIMQATNLLQLMGNLVWSGQVTQMNHFMKMMN